MGDFFCLWTKSLEILWITSRIFGHISQKSTEKNEINIVLVLIVTSYSCWTSSIGMSTLCARSVFLFEWFGTTWYCCCFLSLGKKIKIPARQVWRQYNYHVLGNPSLFLCIYCLLAYNHTSPVWSSTFLWLFSSNFCLLFVMFSLHLLTYAHLTKSFISVTTHLTRLLSMGVCVCVSPYHRVIDQQFVINDLRKLYRAILFLKLQSQHTVHFPHTSNWLQCEKQRHTYSIDTNEEVCNDTTSCIVHRSMVIM